MKTVRSYFYNRIKDETLFLDEMDKRQRDFMLQYGHVKEAEYPYDREEDNYHLFLTDEAQRRRKYRFDPQTQLRDTDTGELVELRDLSSSQRLGALLDEQKYEIDHLESAKRNLKALIHNPDFPGNCEEFRTVGILDIPRLAVYGFDEGLFSGLCGLAIALPAAAISMSKNLFDETVHTVAAYQHKKDLSVA